MVNHTPNDQNARVRARAFALLAGRELGREQLRQALLRSFPEQDTQVDLVVDEFAAKGWQSDERTNEQLGHKAQRMGWGPRRLAYQQKNRGLIDASFPEDIDWLELAHSRIVRRFGVCPETVEPTLRLRILRFLLGRGFTEEQARTACQRWFDANGSS